MADFVPSDAACAAKPSINAEPSLSTNLRNAIEARITEMASPKAAYAGMAMYFNTKPLSALPWDFNLTII